jgi:hypothetical protein
MLFPWLQLLFCCIVIGTRPDLEEYLSSNGHLIPLTTLSHGQGEAIVAFKATVDVGTPSPSRPLAQSSE